MRISTSLLEALSFACLASSMAAPSAQEGSVRRRHPDLTRRSLFEKRQPVPQSTPTSTASSNAALASWEAQAEQSCQSQLSAMGGKVSNPSGFAVCYNMPFVDSRSGVFEAELRMYNISAPTDDWVGVTAQNMMVSLAYLGATVQRTNGTLNAPNMPARREVSESELQYHANLAERQAAAPQEVKILTYIGQLNSNVKGPQINETQVQALLIPEIELMAMNPATKQNVQVVLASTSASFVKGVFDQKSTNAITPATAASASAVANSAIPFVIPGVTLGIPPVGLVITSVWAILFFVFVGLGTVGRYQFREQYQRNMKRQEGASVNTI